MAGNGLTLLEMAGNDWKGLNMVGNGETKDITGTGWNRLKQPGNRWKSLTNYCNF